MCKECDKLEEIFHNANGVADRQTKWNAWDAQRKKCAKEAEKEAKKEAKKKDKEKSKEEKKDAAKFVDE